MGFGSYDESEQENQEVSAVEDDAEAVDVHENDHEGELTFETDATTDELVDKLGEMKADTDE
jgi:hypothetical protein